MHVYTHAVQCYTAHTAPILGLLIQWSRLLPHHPCQNKAWDTCIHWRVCAWHAYVQSCPAEKDGQSVAEIKVFRHVPQVGSSTLRAHHQECIFHMRMRPLKRALAEAPFEHKPTDSQTHSPLPNCEETNCNRKCLGRHVARKQARGVEPHVDKLQGDHATRNYCSSNPHVLKGSRRSHLWLRPAYVPITPLKPACK